MWHTLKRHPIPINAFFRHSLVLTYAYPQALLKPLLPPGLELDTYEDYGFLAIAMVQTESLGPSFIPSFLRQDFFLTGYRIFSRFRTHEGRNLRGLRILRSDTNRTAMALFGNLLTHYRYRKAEVSFRENASLLEIEIKTPHAEADLRVIADRSRCPAPLPAESPFRDAKEARRFAGPLPFTFDYERETHSIVRIEGVRKHWDPQPIAVEVVHNTFLQQEPFRQARPRLANAFYLHDVPYRWKPGVREQLPNLEAGSIS